MSQKPSLDFLHFPGVYFYDRVGRQQSVCAPVQPEVHPEKLPPPDDGSVRVRHDLPLLRPNPLHHSAHDAEVRV